MPPYTNPCMMTVIQEAPELFLVVRCPKFQFGQKRPQRKGERSEFGIYQSHDSGFGKFELTVNISANVEPEIFCKTYLVVYFLVHLGA